MQMWHYDKQIQKIKFQSYKFYIEVPCGIQKLEGTCTVVLFFFIVFFFVVFCFCETTKLDRLYPKIYHNNNKYSQLFPLKHQQGLSFIQNQQLHSYFISSIQNYTRNHTFTQIFTQRPFDIQKNKSPLFRFLI